jgi:hypothetical protein
VPVNSAVYDTVTQVPVLIPANLLPGERPHGVDTFRLRLPGINRPRIVGDKAPKPAPWLSPQQPVIRLCSTDLSRENRLGRRLWKILGTKFEQELHALLALYFASKTPEKASTMVAHYRDLERQIWGRTDSEVFTPELMSLLAAKGLSKIFYPGKTVAQFASYVTGKSAHKNVVAGLTSKRMQDARLVLWWTHTNLTPAFWCETLESAVLVLCLPLFIGGRTFGICTWCKQLFVRGRSDQKHCCKRHTEAERVARWRAKRTRENRGKIDRPRKAQTSR